MERVLLGTVDYIIFAIMLIISASIGIFFRFYGSKQMSAEEYLLAGKNMPIFPVAFSLMASFMSAVIVLGVPADIYSFGTHLVFKSVGYTAGVIVATFIFHPVYFEVQSCTVYEYLEKRFGKVARKLCSLAFLLHMVLYTPVVLYGPALALSAVTSLSTWASVVSIGTVCTFYCTLGGMKAVLWTDAFQALLMFVGIFTVLIKGTLAVGGIQTAFQIANRGGRLVVPGFEFDLNVRYTMWAMLSNSLISAMSTAGANQVQVQRLLTVKNLSRARTALFLSLPLWCVFYLLNCTAGVVVYAYFANCDPMTASSKSISSPDQLIPFFMMSALSKYPGLAGLCICGIFSASLSTASSAINSLAAVTMEDIVRPLFLGKEISDTRAAFCAKVVTFSYGLLSLSLTFVVAKSGNLVQATYTIFGLVGGPVLAMFLLGVMTQRANEKGVVVGLIASIVFAAWISYGTTAYAMKPKALPVSVEGCSSVDWMNITTVSYETSPAFDLMESSATNNSWLFNSTEASTTKVSSENIFPLYRISFMWIGPIAFFSCLIIGYIVSIIANMVFGSTKDVPEELYSPILRFFLRKKDKSMGTGEKTLRSLELEKVNPDTIGSQKTKEIQDFTS